MNPELLLYAYAILGLIVGSFLNVCIYRIPLGKSVVFPGSGCPHCGKPIRFYDNIPVISYILLQGKCRSCKMPISFQYPLVELLTSLAFFFCARMWDFGLTTCVNSLFLSVIIILIFTDYHHQILPNILTLPGIVAGIVLSPLQNERFYSDVLSVRIASLLWPGEPTKALPWVGSVCGALIAGGILLIVGVGYLKLRNKQGIGEGDIKMMAMVGAFLGWRLGMLTIFAGSLLGSLIGIFLILFRNMNMQTKLAFGVFLGVGTAISLFWGIPFLDWYLRFYR
jgi:leader peptidase (prepilin peptidase) / N-methyltransferase